MKLEWYAYYHGFNSNTLEQLNIFRHSNFDKHIRKHLRECTTKEEFAEKVKSELFYYFGSKCEYEVVIRERDGRIIMEPWVGRREPVELDVTDDQDFDWIGFWNKMKERYRSYENGVKIDIRDQVTYKFDEFIDYVWGKKIIRKKKEK